MSDASVAGQGSASSPAAREAHGPPAPGAPPKAKPAAGGQGVRLMASRAKAFSKGPSPEPPAELDFFGRPTGDPRRRL
eukprot:15216927-Alexandrium_andersonii.AAC.1